MRVLVVEDHPKLRSLVTRALRSEGYAVDERGDGVEGLHMLTEVEYDAVVLDLMLPGMDGLQVLKEARVRDVWAPVLVLTARDSVPDRVQGLDAGADDYLVKPFAMAELLGRVRALVRRGGAVRPHRLEVGPLVLDPATRSTTVGDERVDLSPREFALLEYLMRRAGKVVSRTELLDHVWDDAYDGVSNVVDVYVKYLRDKIDRRHGLDLLHTVRGVGYRLGPETEPRPGRSRP
ncbi:MAG: response regulator transcription factor [Nocardioidaceae bacterium]|nr:response regulator transcription factor [Nocardioidaceae bacterium]